MKLIDFIKENKDKITLDKVYCYFRDKKKGIMQFALYRDLKDTNMIYMYQDIFTKQCFTVDEKDIPLYYKAMEIEPNNFIITSRNQWVQLYKKSIKNSIDKNSSEYQRLLREIIKHGGQIVKLKLHNNNEKGVLIGITSSDEDYYYVIAYQKDNEVNIIFDTYCSNLDYINENEYVNDDYELINFIKNNRPYIVNYINNLETDVMITPIITNRNKVHHKIHKDNALVTTFEHCNSFFDRPSKCIEVLNDMLSTLNNSNINSIIIRLLNHYITEYSLYYKPLNNYLKNYYKETFNIKLNNILIKYTKNIEDDNIVSYVTNICNTLKKQFFKI